MPGIQTDNKFNAVIVFAKYPEKGKVKTRLAETAGEEFATDFYKLCAAHTFNELEKLRPSGTRVYLFYSAESREEEIRSWIKSDFIFRPQSGNDLGEKMFNAFNEVFNDGACNAVIIGTDLPDISASIVQQAFSELEYHHAVIGPSSDGGYYLLGLKAVNENIFRNIKWSSAGVFERTTENLKELRWNFKTLTELTDIDTENDLRKWAAAEGAPGLSEKIRKLYNT